METVIAAIIATIGSIIIIYITNKKSSQKVEMPKEEAVIYQPPVSHNVNYLNIQTGFPKKLERRRQLLPWWVKVFIWFFLLGFLIIPVGIIMGLLNYKFEIFLLGLSTNQPISHNGMFLLLLFLFKGITAFALWTEKAWAVGLAEIDAITSILICFLGMAYALFVPQHSFSFRLEPFIIFLYYYRMNGIQHDWESFGSQESIDNVFPETF